MENQQLQRENAKLKAELAALKQSIGAPAEEVLARHRASIPPEEQEQQFQVGECKVVIKPAAGAKPPIVNAAVGGKPRKVAAAGPPVTPDQILEEAEQQSVSVGTKNGNPVDNSDAATRFSLLELR